MKNSKILESKQYDIDFILDKINRSGIDSLTQDEINFLYGSDKSNEVNLEEIEFDDEFYCPNGHFMFSLDEVKKIDDFLVFYGTLSNNMSGDYKGCILFNYSDYTFFSCDFSDSSGNMIQDIITDEELDALISFLSGNILIIKSENKKISNN